jgi:hypothetical protein
MGFHAGEDEWQKGVGEAAFLLGPGRRQMQAHGSSTLYNGGGWGMSLILTLIQRKIKLISQENRASVHTHTVPPAAQW